VTDTALQTVTSSGVTVTVNNATPSGEAPAAPSNLTLSVKRRFVMLSWTDNSNNETGFLLSRCNDGCVDISLPAGATNYKDSSIQSGTRYSVKAVNGSLTSGSSNTVTVP
jgi:hypothetical protein